VAELANRSITIRATGSDRATCCSSRMLSSWLAAPRSDDVATGETSTEAVAS
jgi:hypothetical protein